MQSAARTNDIVNENCSCTPHNGLHWLAVCVWIVVKHVFFDLTQYLVSQTALCLARSLLVQRLAAGQASKREHTDAEVVAAEEGNRAVIYEQIFYALFFG